MGNNFEKLFNLVSDKRLRSSTSGRAREGDLVIASESDKSRVINASAFRRLQQKAQVFSLESNASVRTRLTHSIEVSQIGRYLAQEIIRKIPSDIEICYEKKLAFSNVVETACLLHDIGNPPFGHLGEAAIRKWFTERENRENEEKGDEKYVELKNFDGNAQGFRLITYLSGADEFGLNLTVSTILAFVKYPRINNVKGLFEADYLFSYKKACEELSWDTGKKFPLAILMDLADEISYCMSDLEDGLEKKVISKYALYKEFKDEGYPEPNEEDSDPYPFIKFKTDLINECVQEAAQEFIDNLSDILDGKDLDILKEESSSKQKLGKIKDFAKKNIYSDKNVELLELAGAKIISGLLDSYAPLLDLPESHFKFLIDKRKPTVKEDEKNIFYPFELRLINTIPDNYIKKYSKSMQYYEKDTNEYRLPEERIRAHLLVDFIAGMTDDYALEMYQFLEGIKIHA